MPTTAERAAVREALAVVGIDVDDTVCDHVAKALDDARTIPCPCCKRRISRHRGNLMDHLLRHIVQGDECAVEAARIRYARLKVAKAGLRHGNILTSHPATTILDEPEGPGGAKRAVPRQAPSDPVSIP